MMRKCTTQLVRNILFRSILAKQKAEEKGKATQWFVCVGDNPNLHGKYL